MTAQLQCLNLLSSVYASQECDRMWCGVSFQLSCRINWTAPAIVDDCDPGKTSGWDGLMFMLHEIRDICHSEHSQRPGFVIVQADN